MTPTPEDRTLDQDEDQGRVNNGYVATEGKETDLEKNEKVQTNGHHNDKEKSGFERNYGDEKGPRSSRASIRISHYKSQPPALERQMSIRSLKSIVSRGNWGNRWEFLLSCVGLSVGIGNVWRFPYLAYKNGGGAFLIPYLIMLTLAGKPMYFMELAIGQFAGTGPLKIWSCSPLCKGVGAAMVLVCFVVVIYYNVLMSYSLYLIGMVFQTELPWMRCDGDWANGTDCFVRSQMNVSFNYTGYKSASHIFWERKVLEKSDGIEDLGGLKWDLVLSLLVSWIIVIACLIKGIKTSGKVIYFAATFPYFILISLLIAGLTRTGAMDGVIYFIVPKWERLLDISVWQAAASQMFFSLSVTFGGLIMYASYNDFRHNIFHDAMVVSVLDTVTSVISGLVIFSILGSMAYELDTTVDKVFSGDSGLSFVAYLEALSTLPFPHIWSIGFFFMLFTLGLDSEFAMLECILTSFADQIRVVRRHKLMFTVGTGILCFILGLPCVTRGGNYVFDLMDTYGGGVPILFIAIAECIAFMWIYGYKKFAFDVKYMLNRKLGHYWYLTWTWTSPLILSFIGIYSLTTHQSLAYKPGYTEWSDFIGWILVFIILMPIPLWAFIAIISQKDVKGFQKFINAAEETEKWGPRSMREREIWRHQRKDDSCQKIMPMKPHIPIENTVAQLKKFEANNGSSNNDILTDKV